MGKIDLITVEIVNNMTDETKSMLMSIPKKESLIVFHHSLGRYIRNRYKLWEEGSEICAGMHPDETSMLIIQNIWSTLKRTVGPALLDIVKTKEILPDMPNYIKEPFYFLDKGTGSYMCSGIWGNQYWIFQYNYLHKGWLSYREATDSDRMRIDYLKHG